MCTTNCHSEHQLVGTKNTSDSWKAEELQKFAYPASECVLGKSLPHLLLDIHAYLRYFCTLGGLLPDNEFGVWILAVRITELVFGPGFTVCSIQHTSVSMIWHQEAEILLHYPYLETALRLQSLGCGASTSQLRHLESKQMEMILQSAEPGKCSFHKPAVKYILCTRLETF